MSRIMPDGAGYTIVELMIVLAVSSLLAVAAFGFISGQQNTTEFSQSVRDLEAKLNDIANDTATGYFPDQGLGSSCRLDGTVSNPNTPLEFISASAEQGASPACIFIGKAVQFSPAGQADGMNVFTLTGRRLNAAGDPVRDLAEANPRAAYESD